MMAGRAGSGAMRIRKICLTAAMAAIVVSIVTAISFLAAISPPRDEVEAFDYPPEFFCASSKNRIDDQTDGKCAAYAAAYLLRHFGEDADGETLFPELKRTLGFVSANSITDVFERHGYQARAYHGSVDTLKQRLSEGNPIIVFIRIPGDTHYAVVVGYDEQHMYLADPLAENANASDARYNRVLKAEDFEAVWKTGTLLPDNIYITFFKKADRCVQPSERGSVPCSWSIHFLAKVRTAKCCRQREASLSCQNEYDNISGFWQPLPPTTSFMRAHICCMPCSPACFRKSTSWGLAFRSTSAPTA